MSFRSQVRFSLTVLLALSVRQLAAQSPLSPQGRPFYLDPSAQRISGPARAFYVEQVVDGRGGQTVIGLINHGLNNKPAAVLFRNGLEPELTAWLQQQVPQRPADRLGRPMRLSVGTPGGPAVLLAPGTTAANYVRLLPDASPSPWQWTPAHQGEAEVDALEKQHKP